MPRLLLPRTFICTISATLVIGSPVAFAGTAPTLDQIYQALHVDSIPAAYVFLIDTSSSMMGDGMYVRAKRFVHSFQATLSPHDLVTYYTFDSSVRGPYRNTHSLPATANGAFTDFGPAIARALGTLSAAADRGIQVGGLFLLSDGILDAPNTDTSYRTLHSPGWSQLRAAATVIERQMTLDGYGLTRPVQKSASQGAGRCGGMSTSDPSTCAGVQQTLTSVLGSNVLVFNETSGSQIRTMLNLAQANERRAKAIHRLFSADDHRGVSAAIHAINGGSLKALSLAQGSAPVSVTLTSRILDFPNVEVSGLTAVSEAGYPVRLVGVPATIRLTRQPRIINARLRWTIPRDSGLLGGRIVLTGRLKVSGRVSSPWTPIVRTALIPSFTLGPLVASRESYAGSATRGISVTTWAIIGGAVILILLLCVVIYLSAVQRIGDNLVLFDLATGRKVPLSVHGRRVWKENLEKLTGESGHVRVQGARSGDVRITLRRDVANASRSGHGKLRRDGVLVLASLVFQPGSQDSATTTLPG